VRTAARPAWYVLCIVLHAFQLNLFVQWPTTASQRHVWEHINGRALRQPAALRPPTHSYSIALTMHLPRPMTRSPRTPATRAWGSAGGCFIPSACTRTERAAVGCVHVAATVVCWRAGGRGLHTFILAKAPDVRCGQDCGACARAPAVRQIWELTSSTQSSRAQSCLVWTCHSSLRSRHSTAHAFHT
jgi:hypothetical protein